MLVSTQPVHRTSEQSSWLFCLPVGIYIFAVGYFLSASSYSLYDFPLDDAWIHRVYSRSFAFGHGFQYNPGTQEAGSTSPLWAIITAPAHWLEWFGTGTVVVAVKEIGVGLGLLILREVVLITALLTGSRKGGLLAGALFAIEPRFLFSVLSGMETVLLVVLWLRAARACMTQQWLRAAFLLSLMPPTRPEALLVLPLWIISLILVPKDERPPWRWYIYGGSILWIPMGLWSIFCWLTTGHWLPTTFYVKAHPFHLGFPQLHNAWTILTQHGYAASPYLVVIGIAIYLLWSLRHGDVRVKTGVLYLLIAPLLYALGVTGSREVLPVGYYWTRWLDPASLVLTTAFCIGGSIFLVLGLPWLSQKWHRQTASFPLVVRMSLLGLAGLLTLSGILFPLSPFAQSFAERRARLATDSRAIYLINVLPGVWLNQNTPPEARVAVNDAGAIRYFGNRWTLDLIGLNSAEVVFGKKTAAQLIDEQSIEWLVIFPAIFQKLSLLETFIPRQVFQIPLAEYTICPCPGQTSMVIFEKEKPGSL